MAKVGRPALKTNGYAMVEELTEQFVSDLKEIHQNIYDFEFDCHQVSQMIASKSESTEINIQICTYILEHKKEIALLAPFSYFVECASKIFSLAHAAAFNSMTLTNVYNYYKKRGIKARLSLMNLPQKMKKFHYDSQEFTNLIMSDPTYAIPSTRLEIYNRKYSNCLRLVNDFQPGMKNALAIFFKNRRIMRHSLVKPVFAERVLDYMIASNDVISVSSTELTETEESSSEEEGEEEGVGEGQAGSE
ncbi:hypothetical protein ACTXT7_014824 [Hymenolepis weldensis]